MTPPPPANNKVGAAAGGGGGIDVGVYFVRREARHGAERPYAFKFDPADGFPASNVVNDYLSVRAEDMRGREHDFALDTHGFCVHRLPADEPRLRLAGRDCFVPERLAAYFGHMEAVLKHQLQASKVKVFRHCASSLSPQPQRRRNTRRRPQAPQPRCCRQNNS